MLPKKLPFSVIAGLVIAVFSLGAWATTMQIGIHEAQAQSSEANDRIKLMEYRWARIERFMCVICQREAREQQSLDCNEICGFRSWRSR